MSRITKLIKTLSVKRPLSVEDRYFSVELVDKNEFGEKYALVVAPERIANSNQFKHIRSYSFKVGQRVEIFDQTFLTFLDLTKSSKIKLLLETDEKTKFLKAILIKGGIN
ncbi:hypothetical protein [Shewanella sp. HN-41]|uniref:hypothetical protein n=1 Tax=Shewanella sp. HN-41 TaxID=327275 RepID=UPI00056C8E9B|nr:hypothetical protein [Shewanella sp. HN-41]